MKFDDGADEVTSSMTTPVASSNMATASERALSDADASIAGFNHFSRTFFNGANEEPSFLSDEDDVKEAED